MNKKRIHQLANILEELGPGEFTMRRYVHDCGAPACIAGYAAALTAERPLSKVDLEIKGHYLARDGLGISHEQASQLFIPHDETINDTGERYLTYTVTAQGAAKVLRHFAKTDVIDWTQAVNQMERSE